MLLLLLLLLLLWLLVCFYQTIMALSFPVVFFIQVHNDFRDLYTYTHFYIKPPVRKKMTGTGHSKAQP